MIKSIDDSALAALAAVLAAGPPLRLALVFGSVARGEAHDGSDLDIAILPAAGDLSLTDEGALVSALERVSGREVDVVNLTHVTATLAWRVARDGVCVLSTPPSELHAFLTRVAIEHADWVEMSGGTTERYRARIAARSMT